MDNFFVALETQKFEMLKDVFAENGRQLNPYSPEGFPKSFDGAEGVYKQYSGLTANFGQMKFPGQIFATEDPNFFFVKFKGEIEIKAATDGRSIYKPALCRPRIYTPGVASHRAGQSSLPINQ